MIFVILVSCAPSCLYAEDIRYVSIVFQIWRSLLTNKVPIIPMESLFSPTIKRFDKLCSVFCFLSRVVVIFFSVVFFLFLLCVCFYRKFLAYQTPEENDEREQKNKKQNKTKSLQWNWDRLMLVCFKVKYFHYFKVFVLW